MNSSPEDSWFSLHTCCMFCRLFQVSLTTSLLFKGRVLSAFYLLLPIRLQFLQGMVEPVTVFIILGVVVGLVVCLSGCQGCLEGDADAWIQVGEGSNTREDEANEANEANEAKGNRVKKAMAKLFEMKFGKGSGANLQLCMDEASSKGGMGTLAGHCADLSSSQGMFALNINTRWHTLIFRKDLLLSLSLCIRCLAVARSRTETC